VKIVGADQIVTAPARMRRLAWALDISKTVEMASISLILATYIALGCMIYYRLR